MDNSVSLINTNSRIQWCETAQIISMFLIVLHHSIPYDANPDDWFIKLANSVHYPALAVFFAVSGFFASHFKKWGYWNFMKKRFIRLLIPLFAVNALMLVPKFVIGTLLSTDFVDVSITRFFLSLLHPHQGSVCPHLWFLLALFIMSALSPIIEILLRKRLSCLFICIALTVLAVFPVTKTEWFCMYEIQCYLLFFVLGYFFSFSPANMSYLTKNVKTKLVCVAFLMLLPLSHSCFSSYTRDFSKIFGAFFIIYLSMILADKLDVVNHFFRKKIMIVYLLSLCFQNFIEAFLVYSKLPWELISLSMFLTGILAPLIIYCVIDHINKNVRISPLVLAVFGMK